VRADEHLAELDEVAVLFVVYLDHAPGVAATAHFAAFGGLDFGVGADYGEGDFGHDLVVFRDGLFVVQLVSGSLEDLDVVMLDVGKNLEMGVSDGTSYLERTITLSLHVA